MSLAYWRDGCRVHHSQIDHEHSTLLNLLESLYRGILIDQKSDEIQAILETLINTMFLHCETEEQLMEGYNYPGRVPHIAQHEQVLDEVFNLRLTAKHSALSLDAVYDLAHWMTRHIWEQDLPMVNFIQQQQKNEGIILSHDHHTGCLIHVA